jgi:hypothetical protein
MDGDSRSAPVPGAPHVAVTCGGFDLIPRFALRFGLRRGAACAVFHPDDFDRGRARQLSSPGAPHVAVTCGGFDLAHLTPVDSPGLR